MSLDNVTDEQKASQEALEAACVEYLRTHTEGSTAPLLLDGFIIYIQGREMSMEGAARTTNIWATPESQAVSLTLGLESMLHKNVDMWFRSGDTRDDD